MKRMAIVAAALLSASVSCAGRSLAASLPVATSTVDSWRTCILSGTSSTTTVVDDTFVNQASPNTNSGTASTMDVRSSTSANRRAYVRFDLGQCSPTISTTATVADAALQLFVTQIPSVCRSIDLFRLSGPWTESTITWNNQPVGTAPNNPPTAGRSAVTTIGASPCTVISTGVYVSWNVTADVRLFVGGSSANLGWLLRDDAEDSTVSRNTQFSTAEANNTTRAPRLLVTYRP
jgi:hypothetical protein